MRACVCVCARVRVCACVYVCERACVCARARARMYTLRIFSTHKMLRLIKTSIIINYNFYVRVFVML